MCYFIKQTEPINTIEKRYNATFELPDIFEKQDVVNGFAHALQPVITDENPSIIQQFQWGLVPFWAKDDSIKKYTLNAKIETLKEKPSFRNVIDKRCLVIASGFYEWQWLDAKGKNKQKYYIQLANENLLSFGGIYSSCTNKETGEVVESYSIVTTKANSLMEEIHNTKKRMPIILTKQTEQDWLSDLPVQEFASLDVDLVAEKVN